MRFDFASPGVRVTEIDRTTLPPTPQTKGPILIGRFLKGPVDVPTVVNNMDEFVSTFGDAVVGTVNEDYADVWRSGNRTSPHYAAIAAKIALGNNIPVTVIRVVGDDSSEATGGGVAGWQFATTSSTATSFEHAVGLFVAPSGSANTTGSLAAVFYVSSGSLALSGSTYDVDNGTPKDATGSCAAFSGKNATSPEFDFIINDSEGKPTLETRLTFDNNSSSPLKTYVRDLNTNPIRTNTTLYPTTNSGYRNYWVGETFENNLPTSSTGYFGILLPLEGASFGWADMAKNSSVASSGWVFAADTQVNGSGFDPSSESSLRAERLFKFHSLSRDNNSNNYAAVVKTIRASSDPVSDPYCTFDVEVEDISTGRVVERFTNMTLNPSDVNYIARKMGTAYYEWDETNKVLVRKGSFPNQSRFVRVEMYSEDLTPSAIPFGFVGPETYAKFTLTGDTDGSGSVTASNNTVVSDGTASTTNMPDAYLTNTIAVDPSLSIEFEFPTVRLVSEPTNDNTAFGNGTAKQVYGFNIFEGTSDTTLDKSVIDGLRTRAVGSDSYLSASFYFTLDDLKLDNGTLVYESGSRAGETSYTHDSGTTALLPNVAGFRVPLYGGFDGFDIQESDPFGDHVLGSSPTLRTNYAFYSLSKGLDIASNKNIAPGSLIAMPGVRETGLTDKMLTVATTREDLLAVVDLDAGQKYVGEDTRATVAAAPGTVTSLLSNKRSRRLNTSYGCTFFPDVMANVNGDGGTTNFVKLPSSVVGLGVMTFTENNNQVWFAPAGFNRGGLADAMSANGAVTPSHLMVDLTQRDMDDMYSANVNPVKRVNGDLVVFGQKTLQVKKSALDRINVRRLSIFIKDFMYEISKGFLFEQNVPSTWSRFKALAEPRLAEVQSGLGIEDYRLVLDDTTTTDDLIDRNIMYVKLFVKPTRSIEYIQIDFTLENSGATL